MSSEPATAKMGTEAAAPRPLSDAECDELFAPYKDFQKLYLAVSGGPDSMALLVAAAGWQRRYQAQIAVTTSSAPHQVPQLVVLTVDHQLRESSRADTELVVQTAQDLGLAAKRLVWEGPHPTTGLQDAARLARYNLMTSHIQGEALSTAGQSVSDRALLLAHHRDDLAETVLMRLSRGTGVDGLAAIRTWVLRDGVLLCRPFLGIAKARLTATIDASNVEAVNDPSNSDLRFERARLRHPRARQARLELDLDDAALARTARRLERARRALDFAVDAALEPCFTCPVLNQAGVFVWRWPHDALPDEIGIRLLGRLLPVLGGRGGKAQGQWIKLSGLERLWSDMQRNSFAGATAMNCVVTTGERAGIADARFVIYREPARHPLPDMMIALDQSVIWDDRFLITMRRSSGAGATCEGVRLEHEEQLHVRGARRSDLSVFDFDPVKAELSCPADALCATPLIEDAAGALYLPALGLWREGAARKIDCEFVVDHLRKTVGQDI